MASIRDTAYPSLRQNYSQEELEDLFTPNKQEVKFAFQNAKKPFQRIRLLTLLKTFQYLNYFLMWGQIPRAIPKYIATHLGWLFTSELKSTEYDQSGSRTRHMNAIRGYLGVKKVGKATYQFIDKVAYRTALSKEHLNDIINVVIEELIRHNHELPAFSRIEGGSFKMRIKVNEYYINQIVAKMTDDQIKYIDLLLDGGLDTTLNQSTWQKIKEVPSQPTIKNNSSYIEHVEWLGDLNKQLNCDDIPLPALKRRQFYLEAYAADLTHIKRFTEAKKYAFVLLLVQKQFSEALDNLVLIFIQQVQKLHSSSKKRLDKYHKQIHKQLEDLITYLADITEAYQTEGSKEMRFDAIDSVMPLEPEKVNQQCLEYLAYAQDNYYLCMLPYYNPRRRMLFDYIGFLDLKSSSQDQVLIDALGFINKHRSSRKTWLELPEAEIDLKWVPKKWKKVAIKKGDKKDLMVHRKYFELCVLSELMHQIKSGDIYVDGSKDFDDYRKHLIGWEDYKTQIHNYGKVAGIPTQTSLFIDKVRKELIDAAFITDQTFPKNTFVEIVDGELCLSKTPKKQAHPQFKDVDRYIKQQMKPINIVDILIDTEKWLKLSDYFHNISGDMAKIDNYPKRFITTVFCYGCFLGPSETARAVDGSNRKQINRINLHHVTEQRLNRAIVKTINSYNKFTLPKYWGTGKTASADGTKWDVFEKNIFAEYHIRYGGYGGVAYYHVSDTYIALFSHFIPCGVYEAVYILDGLLKNTSDIQPDTIHGDTHAQSLVVFGLSYLLGIKLMPRIKRIKDLTFYHPGSNTNFQHIDALFGDTINWSIIETHLPDMLRVAVSIKNGKINASTILRRLGTRSRKNKLYFAFRELGKVVRTKFTLNYIQDIQMRQMIQAATNKSEEFNNFTNWVAFGNKGVIPSNLLHEQTKMIRYNQLVANLIILYNVDQMTLIINELRSQGFDINLEVLADLSPYRTDHINRFGSYTLNMERNVHPLNHHLVI